MLDFWRVCAHQSRVMEKSLIFDILGAVLSLGFAVHQWLKSRALRRACDRLEAENTELKQQLARHEGHALAQEHLKTQMDHHIKGLCAESLEKASSHLLKQSEAFFRTFSDTAQHQLSGHTEMVKHLTSPLEKGLKEMYAHINALEQSRTGAYEKLSEKLKGLSEAHAHFYKQTGQLVQALKVPNIRGRWGELQLRRLVEWSGMLPFCDFFEQKMVEGDGRILKPDLIIRLPQERCIVVDAKSPLPACFIDDTPEDISPSAMNEAVQKMKQHIYTLSRRDYVASLERSPDFVLLFLPTEALLIKALEVDPTLFDYGADKSVLLATPMTLIALLKVIALGWHQERLSKNAEDIGACGKKLFKSLCEMLVKVRDVGKHMTGSVKAYNGLVQAFDDAVLPEAETLGQLAGAPSTLGSVKKIAKQPKQQEASCVNL